MARQRFTRRRRWRYELMMVRAQGGSVSRPKGAPLRTGMFLA